MKVILHGYLRKYQENVKGKTDIYLLEGKELEFYIKKLEKK